MPSDPTVSVIVPTYNRAHLIARALESVCAQTFTDWECLVVDDASTDDTDEVVRSFGDPRVQYLRHETNRRGGAARNTGIAAARGEFLAFLDSDDEWVPAKLERQLEVFATTSLEKLGMVLCGTSLALNGEIYRTRSRPTVSDGWCYEAALAQQVAPLATPTWLVRRASFSALPLFDETFRSKQDREYVVRASQEVQLAWVREPLVIAHKDGTDHVSVNNSANQVDSQLRFIEKYEPQLRRRPKLHRRYHHGLAGLYHSQGNMRGVRRHLLLAVQASPLNPKAYFWLISGYLGRVAFGAALRMGRQDLKLGGIERPE